MELLYKFRKSIIFFLQSLTVVSIVAVFLNSWNKYYAAASFEFKGNYVVIVVYFIMLLVFMSVFGAHKYGTARLHDLVYSTCLATIGTNFFTYFELCLIARALLAPWGIIIASIIQCIFAFICCYCTNSVYFLVNHVKNILAITGGSENSIKFINKMRRIENRYKIEHSISPDKGIEAIKDAVNPYDAVLSCDDFDKSMQDEIIKYCYCLGKKIYIQPSTTDIIMSDSFKAQIFDSPVLVCKTRGLTNEQKAIKRIFDIVVSFVGLIIASPIMLGVALAIKLCDGGHVFFKQNRLTRDGKIFNVLKFRSMYETTDKNDLRFALKNDDRITPVGKVIRACRLDELPQLINILKGDMSIVGPRPERPAIAHEFMKEFPDFNLRHRVKGGLTGYAQIYGKYNTSPVDKLHMDLMYIENYSFWLDLKLIVMTFKILFVKESTEGFDEDTNQNIKASAESESNEGEN